MTDPTPSTDPNDADALRREIEQTRAELAQNVDALSDKLNVKKQASKKVDDVKSTAADTVGNVRTSVQQNPRQTAIAAGAVAAVVALVVVIRRRRSS